MSDDYRIRGNNYPFKHMKGSTASGVGYLVFCVLFPLIVTALVLLF